MLTLNDGRSELWQWDTGRKLTVDADCTQVHFSNKLLGRSIDVDVIDGVANIPDVILQTDKDFTAWAFVGSAENGYTKISKVFKVNKRNKPADYVFTPVEQMTIDEIAAIAQSVRDDANAGKFNGFSPVVDVENIEGGHRVTITDKDGNKTFDVMDGKDGQGGGVTSWNDLMDRPTETIGVDTLTWDGNTEGLVSAANQFYNVSNAIVSMSDLANGYIITVGDAASSFPSEAVEEIAPGALILAGNLVWLISEEGVGVDLGDGLVLTEAGVYFLSEGDAFISSLTIPGYTGFAKEVLKPEILPRAAILYTDGTYLYNTEDTMSETNRISKAKLFAHVRSEDVVKIARSIDGVTAIYFASVVSISDAYPYGIVVVSAGSDALYLYTAEYTAEQGTHDRQKAPPIWL